MELLNQKTIVFLRFWNACQKFSKENFKPIDFCFVLFCFLKGPVYLSELSLMLDTLIFLKRVNLIFRLSSSTIHLSAPRCKVVFYHIVMLLKYYSEAFRTITPVPISELTVLFILGAPPPPWLQGCLGVVDPGDGQWQPFSLPSGVTQVPLRPLQLTDPRHPPPHWASRSQPQLLLCFGSRAELQNPRPQPLSSFP